jgi:hypothetical protein|tara:strand:- start:111 stop:476 length:366 start_codon:yes stop_codon:yes gene_type:complete
MAYNTAIIIDNLEVEYNYDYLGDMGDWRTSKELKDVVVGAGVTLSANWNGKHIHTMDSEILDIAAPNPDNYTPFKDLTKEQCHEFIKSDIRYWSLMSVLTGQVYSSMQTTTGVGLCALPWE